MFAEFKVQFNFGGIYGGDACNGVARANALLAQVFLYDLNGPEIVDDIGKGAGFVFFEMVFNFAS